MNEKIFWMKLNYHNPMVTRCCDKFRVKDYVTEKLGDGFVVPTINSWKSADEIDFDALPERFVLKVNWSSGYNVIVKDKHSLDIERIKKKIDYWLQPQQNSYYQTLTGDINIWNRLFMQKNILSKWAVSYMTISSIAVMEKQNLCLSQQTDIMERG